MTIWKCKFCIYSNYFSIFSEQTGLPASINKITPQTAKCKGKNILSQWRDLAVTLTQGSNLAVQTVRLSDMICLLLWYSMKYTVSPVKYFCQKHVTFTMKSTLQEIQRIRKQAKWYHIGNNMTNTKCRRCYRERLVSSKVMKKRYCGCTGNCFYFFEEATVYVFYGCCKKLLQNRWLK